MYSYYYGLFSKGPLLRKMVDGGVCDSRLDPADSSSPTNDVNMASVKHNMASVKQYLTSFPDGKSSLAFAILNDHSMTNISSTIDESIRKSNSNFFSKK